MIEHQFTASVTARLKQLERTRSDLARAMGVKPQHVTDYLNGRSKPGPEVIERFFRAIGLRPMLSFETVADPERVAV